MGPLTLDELRDATASGGIDSVIVAFSDFYGRLFGKRFDAEFFCESGADGGTHACDYLLTVDMEMEPVAGYTFANWELGYGDVHLVPDLGTLRQAAWLDRTAIVLCDVIDQKSHNLVAVAPRSILRAQIDAAAELGYTAMAASELEYYLYRQSYRKAARRHWHGLEPIGWYLEDYHLSQGLRQEPFAAAARRALRDSGIPVETSKGEWGRGQHELNIRYAEALEMADRHSIFKHCLKDIAELQGCSVTFMAKPHTGQAGSSCHVHLSLWADDQSAFPGDDAIGGSEVFGWFLAGWMDHVSELMAFYAPTVNSYKRYEDGSWAPTRVAWSVDNRTAGFRVVGTGPALRIECRLPGADCNPYLTYAAALASGLDGIRRRLEPPPLFDGDVYSATDLEHVPSTLPAAIAALESSRFAREALGDAVIDHYLHFLRTEQAAFDTSVTDWERARYFERI